MEECPGSAPVALDRSIGNLQRLCNLVDGHACEEPHLDDPRHPWIEGLETGESPVHSEDLRELVLDGCVAIVELDPNRVAAPLGGAPTAGVVDRDLPHGGGGHRHQVSAVVDLEVLGADEPEIGLVNQSRGSEGRIPSASPELAAGDPAQLVINTLEQQLAGVYVA